jgi:hypothetical protein
MAKRFYYQVMGETFGPMSGVELRDKAMAGDVSPDTLVKVNDDGNWVLAARLKNLFDDRGRPISHSAIIGTPRPAVNQEGADGSAEAAGEAATATAAPPESPQPESPQQELGGTAESPSDGIDFTPEATEAGTVADLPDVPAVYALYAGRGRDVYVAFIGVTQDLKTRIEQHLVSRDSRVAGATSAVSINPEYVTEVRWWTHPMFLEQSSLEAAMLIACDILDPVLRSESGISDQARKLYNEPPFVARIMELIKERAAGHFVVRTLDDAWEQIDAHKHRLAELERRLAQLEGKDAG